MGTQKKVDDKKKQVKGSVQGQKAGYRPGMDRGKTRKS